MVNGEADRCHRIGERRFHFVIGGLERIAGLLRGTDVGHHVARSATVVPGPFNRARDEPRQRLEGR